MKNQRYTHADHIALAAPAAVKSGQPLRVGALAGVVVADAKSGDRVSLWLDGSYDLTVDGAVAVGAVVYIKANSTLTATATGNNPFGVALTAKGSGSGVVEVAPFGNNPAVAVAAA